MDKTKSKNVTTSKVIFGGRKYHGRYYSILGMCPHKDLFYCFINKRKTLGIYIDLSSLWTPPLLFLSLGGGMERTDIFCPWDPLLKHKPIHNPKRNSVPTSSLFQSMVFLWFCCSASSLQLNDQVKCNMEVWLRWEQRICIHPWHTWNLTVKMSPVLTLWLECLTNLTASEFQADHLKFYRPVPRSLLYVTRMFSNL